MSKEKVCEYERVQFGYVINKVLPHDCSMGGREGLLNIVNSVDGRVQDKRVINHRQQWGE